MTKNEHDAIQAAFENAERIDPIPMGDPPAESKATAGSKKPRKAKLQHMSSRYDGIPVVRNENGVPIWCTGTAVEILRHLPEWQGVLYRDEFSGCDMLARPIPGSEDSDDFQPRAIQDLDVTQAQVWFHHNGFSKASIRAVADALEAVAFENRVDPLKDWLLGLTWDGQPRLSAWLTIYLGVEESEYSAEVGKRWAISAVARVFEPGCKADCCLILEGRQGGGKSSALRVLAGAEYFADALPDLAHKDAKLSLRGKWIFELSELAALNRSSLETAKAFISRREEKYRRPYGRKDVTEPRRCVFAGTTNEDSYLRDTTGNRRFWPVRVGPINIDALSRDREQLWAEAVHAYRAGERWWLDTKFNKIAAMEQAERVADDP
ncbi:virulence-associated E family protein [Lutimaribacter saemankumensis]|uniref:Virulence-associated protein E n=1 Tax=Lutimaribacter saemankumensis TaxID=490829 RepID=A0A1G8MPZ8_9RHOB|nr:virulence-associated E family protein [Lutimaribacter saemankumensis]SDI69923.1 Virulence-associated protein E [Lutimaribacter saemankumensis]